MSILNETLIIEKYLKPLINDKYHSLDINDDAAILPSASKNDYIVVSKDALAVNVHMLEDDTPYDMAKKSLRVNLSDLASMGSKPVGFLLALCLSENEDELFISEFTRGLKEDIEIFNIPLLGGDIIKKKGPFTVTVTAFGKVKKDYILKRSNAKENDSLWVTGTIGDSSLGLQVLKNHMFYLSEDDQNFLIDRYRIPQPRINFINKAAKYLNSCIDISDGIISDIRKIATSSRLRCHIDIINIPKSPAVLSALNENISLYELILNGGDDYELAFSSNQKNDNLINEIAKEEDLKITKIGYFTEGNGIELHSLPDQLQGFSISGYNHT